MGQACLRNSSAFWEAAIVDAGRGEFATRGQQQRKAPAEAEADHPNVARGALVLDQPLAHGFDAVEQRTLATAEVAHQGAQTTEKGAAIEQIRGGREIPSPASQSA